MSDSVCEYCKKNEDGNVLCNIKSDAIDIIFSLTEEQMKKYDMLGKTDSKYIELVERIRKIRACKKLDTSNSAFNDDFEICYFCNTG